MKIQGFMRKKWLVNMFSNMKAAAIFIQVSSYPLPLPLTYPPKRHYRRHKDKVKPMLAFYQNEVQIMQGVSRAENASRLSSKLVLAEQSRGSNVDIKETRMLRDNLTHSDRKITFFPILIDFEALTDTSEIYDPLWNKQFAQLQKELFLANHDVTSVHVGEAHSAATATNGRIYTWGWNDHMQLSFEEASKDDSFLLDCTKKPVSIPWIEAITRPITIAVGSNHTLVLDQDRNLYSAGINTKGSRHSGKKRQ